MFLLNVCWQVYYDFLGHLKLSTRVIWGDGGFDLFYLFD
jgi:hypothetical protein